MFRKDKIADEIVNKVLKVQKKYNLDYYETWITLNAVMEGYIKTNIFSKILEQTAGLRELFITKIKEWKELLEYKITDDDAVKDIGIKGVIIDMESIIRKWEEERKEEDNGQEEYSAKVD